MTDRIERVAAKILPLLAVILGYFLCLYLVGGLIGAELYGSIVASGLYLCLMIFICTRRVMKKLKELEQKLEKHSK